MKKIRLEQPLTQSGYTNAFVYRNARVPQPKKFKTSQKKLRSTDICLQINFFCDVHSGSGAGFKSQRGEKDFASSKGNTDVVLKKLLSLFHVFSFFSASLLLRFRREMLFFAYRQRFRLTVYSKYDICYSKYDINSKFFLKGAIINGGVCQYRRGKKF